MSQFICMHDDDTTRVQEMCTHAFVHNAIIIHRQVLKVYIGIRGNRPRFTARVVGEN